MTEDANQSFESDKLFLYFRGIQGKKMTSSLGSSTYIDASMHLLKKILL